MFSCKQGGMVGDYTAGGSRAEQKKSTDGYQRGHHGRGGDGWTGGSGMLAENPSMVAAALTASPGGSPIGVYIVVLDLILFFCRTASLDEPSHGPTR